MKNTHVLPEEVQEEIISLLEDKTSLESFIKASKIRQARIIISLRKKYEFKAKGLGMN